MKREALTSKILVLGVDGMDPRLAKHCMDKGLMPNLKTLVEKGSAKEDLGLLGAVPTITPPMWTTLATGAYPMTHGITCFWNQHPEKLDTLKYALDSRECKAEQLWNVFAEAGKKTLVWHWPGSSWPPTSDSDLLHVVDGTQPACVNWGVAIIDWEKMLVAKPDFEKNLYKPKANNDTGAGCILTDVNAADEMSTGMVDNLDNDIKESKNIMFSHEDGDLAIDRVPFDVINTPLKDADGWSFELPEGAKEFTVITSTGLIRRPALLLKNDNGEYDTIVLYKNKKVQEPLITLTKDDGLVMVYDEIMLEDGTKSMGNRMVRIMDLEPDGSYLRLWMSCALDVNNDLLWHPKSLYKEIAENIRALTSKTYGSFVVDRLDYLRAGGRCSTIAMLGANLLSLKPSIIVNNKDGSMTVGKKYRGKLEKVLPQYIDDKLAEFDNINPKRVFITHSGISLSLIHI